MADNAFSQPSAPPTQPSAPPTQQEPSTRTSFGSGQTSVIELSKFGGFAMPGPVPQQVHVAQPAIGFQSQATCYPRDTAFGHIDRANKPQRPVTGPTPVFGGLGGSGVFGTAQPPAPQPQQVIYDGWGGFHKVPTVPEPTLVWCETIGARIEMKQDQVAEINRKKEEIKRILDSIQDPNVAIIVAEQASTDAIHKAFSAHEARTGKKRRFGFN